MRTLGTGLVMIAFILLESGQRQRAEDIYRECCEITERSGQANLWFMTMALKGILATLDGRLEEADEIGRQMRTRGQELDFTGYADVQEIYAGTGAKLLLGKNDEIIRLVGSIELYSKIMCGLYLTITKPHAEVIEFLDSTVVARPGIGTPADEMSAVTDISNLMAAVLVRHHRAAKLLLNRFSGTGLCIISLTFPTCVARHLGGAAALLERYDEARKYYQEAIKVCTEMPFRPELALTRLNLAELLLEHYPDEKKEALEHLDFAISEFREMKMQPSLERALRHKDILKA